jgi:hypothetical protein
LACHVCRSGLLSCLVTALRWSLRKGWEDDISLSLLSIPTATWISEVKAHYQVDQDMLDLLTKWNANQLDTRKYAFRDGLLFYKGRLCLGTSADLRAQVLHFVHSDPLAGHSRWARRDFYWKSMKADLKRFIRECSVC